MSFPPNHLPPDVDIHSVNVTQESPLAELSKLVVGLVIVVVLSIIAINIAVDITIAVVPQALERPLAKVFEHSDDEAPVDIFLTQRIQPILTRLTNAMPTHDLEYRVEVLDEGEVVNAGSYPGGYMVMYRALVERAQNDDELAFILAHEIGHYHHRHHLRGLGKGVILSLLFSSVFNRQDITPMANQVAGSTLLNFSRDDEYAADDFAYTLTKQAGYNPEKGMLFFNELTSSTLDWMSTHPASSHRIQRLRQRYGATQNKSAEK